MPSCTRRKLSPLCQLGLVENETTVGIVGNIDGVTIENNFYGLTASDAERVTAGPAIC